MQAIEKFQILLMNMQSRLGMYVINQDYPSLVSFIDGYLIACRDVMGIDIVGDFRQWMFKKYKTHFAIHEAWFIFQQVADSNPELAISKLFEHWQEFLEWKLKAK